MAYIGNSPAFSTQAIYRYTITVAATTITGADDLSKALTYTIGYVAVYVNGIKLIDKLDYTATSGSSVVFANAVQIGDIVEIIAYGVYAFDASNANTANTATFAISANNASFANTANTASFATTANTANTANTASTSNNSTYFGGQPTSYYATASSVAGISSFPAGTIMVFQQTAAPTGWTKSTAYNDRAMRIVNGAVGAGGVQAFSTVFGRTTTDYFTLTTYEMPSHNHPSSTSYYQSGASYGMAYGGPDGPVGSMVAAEGGNGAHYHGLDIRVTYVDFILATKN